MKELLTLLLVFCFNFSFSQKLPDYDAGRLKTTKDYQPADAVAFQAADYLLSAPFNKEDENLSK